MDNNFRRLKDEYLPPILNGISGTGVLAVSIFTNLRMPIQKFVATLIGLIILYTGILVVVWATVFIKEAILGEVQPRLNILVKNGPYKFVRHPVYLGMTIALLGATIVTRNWLGMIGVFVLFLPSEIYRARLEEKALEKKFGVEWREYENKTSFLISFFNMTK